MPVTFCSDFRPSSKMSEHAVWKVLRSNELLQLLGQTKKKGLRVKAPLKVQKRL